jgi:hypothetical protein
VSRPGNPRVAEALPRSARRRHRELVRAEAIARLTRLGVRTAARIVDAAVTAHASHSSGAGEPVERIRGAELLRRLAPLRRRVVRWVTDHLGRCGRATPLSLSRSMIAKPTTGGRCSLSRTRPAPRGPIVRGSPPARWPGPSSKRTRPTLCGSWPTCAISLPPVLRQNLIPLSGRRPTLSRQAKERLGDCRQEGRPQCGSVGPPLKDAEPLEGVGRRAA